MTDRIPPKDMVPAVGAFSEIIVPTRLQKDAYLERVALGRSLHGAAADIGLPYMSFVRERKADEAFNNDVNIAMLARGSALLEIGLEQCTVGVDKVLTHQGRISYEYNGDYHLNDAGDWVPEAGGTRKPVVVKELITSNPMLLAFLKALYPERFKERIEINTPEQQPRTIEDERRRVLDGIAADLLAMRDPQAGHSAPSEPQTGLDPDEDLL